MHNNFVKLLGAICVTCLLTISSMAGADGQQAALHEAQEKMRATFSNAIVTDFRESPIPGIYEAHMVDKLIYYHPENELLILGEIWTKDGRSLTALRRAERASELFEQIPKTNALVIGPPDGVSVVEFTSPNCGYCMEYHAFVSGLNAHADKPIKREVFFTTRHDSVASRLAEHILCAEDKEVAFLKVYGSTRKQRDAIELESCTEGKKLLLAHNYVSQEAGVSVTPTLYVDRTPIIGFRRAELVDVLSSGSDSKVNKGD